MLQEVLVKIELWKIISLTMILLFHFNKTILKIKENFSMIYVEGVYHSGLFSRFKKIIIATVTIVGHAYLQLCLLNKLFSL